MDNSKSQEKRIPVTREALDGLLQLREQFKENHPGQVLDDSTEIIRQMREERSQYLAGKLNTEAIKELFRASDEIMRAHPGVIYDSVETLHQLREERDRELEQR
ncbi:MAG: hypothetical protein WCD86_26850 [Ktedonobacteraceae bacterium]